MSISPQLVASHGLGSTPLQIALFGLLSVEDAPATCIALCLRASVPADVVALGVETMPDVCDLLASVAVDVEAIACGVVADVSIEDVGLVADVEQEATSVAADVVAAAATLTDCDC
jgi:hypothetical protein